jgi:hypothetical protein
VICYVFSKKTAINIVDNVNKDHDWKVVKMRNDIQDIHSNETTNRGLRSKAASGVGGFALFGDNVGKIINPRLVIVN